MNEERIKKRVQELKDKFLADNLKGAASEAAERCVRKVAHELSEPGGTFELTAKAEAQAEIDERVRLEYKAKVDAEVEARAREDARREREDFERKLEEGRINYRGRSDRFSVKMQPKGISFSRETAKRFLGENSAGLLGDIGYAQDRIVKLRRATGWTESECQSALTNAAEAMLQETTEESQEEQEKRAELCRKRDAGETIFLTECEIAEGVIRAEAARTVKDARRFGVPVRMLDEGEIMAKAEVLAKNSGRGWRMWNKALEELLGMEDDRGFDDTGESGSNTDPASLDGMLSSLGSAG